MTDPNEQFFTPDYGFINSDFICYDYAAQNKVNK